MSKQDGDTGPFQHIPDIYGVIVIACKQQATFKENNILSSEVLSRQPASPEPPVSCAPVRHPCAPAEPSTLNPLECIT